MPKLKCKVKTINASLYRMPYSAMKILFIIPSYKPAYIYGGTTVVVSLLAESLASHGHQVTVYTTTANGKNELEVETGKEIIIDGVKVFYFKRITKDHSHISPA